MKILLFCEKIMIQLDAKDRKILFYLLIDSRQSLRAIGKKVGISKELALYRIQRLLRNNIITSFYIIINFEKLGYSIMTTHYKFVNINTAIKEDILHYFVSKKNTFYVGLTEGSTDLQVDFYLGKPREFEALIDEIKERYHPYLAFKSSKLYVRAEFYSHTFLFDHPISKTIPTTWDWGNTLASIDDVDFNILSELSKDSRMSTKTIAGNIQATISTVSYRIKKLERQKIIGQYTVNIDWSQIGYRLFHLQISLRDYTKKNQIIEYLKKNPHLIRRFKFLSLDLDLHFTFLLQHMEQLRNIIEDLSNRFPDAINDYIYYSTFKIYKYNFMIPEILETKNPLNRGQAS
jgi:DNA-binding Lrp family transcriptional regulator